MIECGYDKVNYIALAQPKHHTRGRLNAIIVEVPGYPFEYKTDRKGFKVQQFRHLKDGDGRTIKQPVAVWRGFDKRIKAKYTGERMRQMRADNGVGRPPVAA